MASVWKRLQRVNKRAAKFQYTASYHRIDLETTPKWQPNKLSVVWSRRSRRVLTEPLAWEPELKDPLKGSVIFSVPENHTVAVTLFKDSRTNELEDKDWTFVVEDVSSSGKRRRLASAQVNMRRYASLSPAQFTLTVPLTPLTGKVVAVSVHLTLHSVLLREGRATDEDMQSLASLLSVNNNSDVAVLEDLDDEDYTLSDQSTRQMLDFRQQMEEMTQSLTNSDIAATPNSVQSLTFDNCRTPTAPMSPISPHSQTPTTPIPKDNIELQISELPDAKTSTPKSDSCQTDRYQTDRHQSDRRQTDSKDDLKSVAFKPRTMAKMNLKPLDLKINLNNIGLDANENEDTDKTPINEVNLAPTRGERSGGKTPVIEEESENPELGGEVAELLEWCQLATKEYPSVKVTDLSLSFKSGLALCAIIHHFRPDLIDYSGLQPDDPGSNVRAALAAAARLGVAPVMTSRDVLRDVPDKLAIMTFLFQLRAHFTGNELQVEQLGSEDAASSYVVGRHDTDGSVQHELFSRELSERRSQRLLRSAAPKRPSLLEQSRAVLARALSPDVPTVPTVPTANWFTDPLPPRPEKLMTRKELTDPFASDDEETEQTDNIHTQKPIDIQKPIDNQTSIDIQKPIDNQKSVDNQKPIEIDKSIDKLDDGKKIVESEVKNKQEDKPLEISTSDRLLLDPLTLLAREQEQKLKQNNEIEQKENGELPKPTPQLLSRHDELKERARLLLEATKREAREKDKKRQSSKEKEDFKNEIMNGITKEEFSPTKKPATDEERQTVLRERARKLIADARAGIVVSGGSTNRASPQKTTMEVLTTQSVLDQFAAGGMEQLDAFLNRSDSYSSSPASRHSLSPTRSDNEDVISIKSLERQSPLKSFSALVENLTADTIDDNEQSGDISESSSYIAMELRALDREQLAVDAAAAALETKLRAAMTHPNHQEEDRLMSEWFNLVNKKNALLRRQMQLNILEQEEDLSRRCELLAQELRLSLGVDEWRKTPGQKRRERTLLQELVSAVNERDRLVQEMDEQEKAIADDNAIERNLSQVELQRKNNCILQ